MLAFPLIVLAVWAYQRGYTDPGLALLEHRARLVKAGGANLAGLRYGYPPLPILLLVLLPAGTPLPSIVTCLCASVLLGYVSKRLLRRTSAITVIALVLPFVAVPMMWLAASEYFAPLAAMAFLAIALDGFVRFAAHGETDGGFTAGIALALSLCCDPGALLYGLVMCAMAPLISHVRYRGAHSTGAIAAVLFFPIAAVAAGWLFVVWKFSGAFPGSLDYAAGARLLSFPSGVSAALARAFKSVGTDILHVPLYFAAAALQCYRRPAVVLGLALPVATLTAALWLGFAYSQVNAYLLLTILALVMISESASRRFEPALVLVAFCQVALAFFWPLTSANYSHWFQIVS